MAQQNNLTPLTSNVSHGKEANNIKFLIVEDEQNGQPIRRKAYFHQPVDGVRSQHQHWSQPLTYEAVNSWEADDGWKTIPVPLPAGVEYSKEFIDVKNIPVIKNRIKKFIDIEEDNNWLKKYFGVELEKCIHPGVTGMYLKGRVGTATTQTLMTLDYADDISRLKTAKDKSVVVKLYFTHEMTRQDQMDRLYEEALAHCELKHSNIVDTYSVRYRVREAHPNAEGEINAIDGRTDLHSFIIMEYSEIGSMTMLMKKLVESQLGFAYYHLYLQDIIAGLVYLHSTGRAHREFNYTNCLAVQAARSLNFNRICVDNPTMANCIIKICDFAYTKKFDQQSNAEQQLMRNWQSMDVIDLSRNILWHCFKYIGRNNLLLQSELFKIAKFLAADDIQQRLDNLQLLLMNKEDEEKYVRDFMNQIAVSKHT